MFQVSLCFFVGTKSGVFWGGAMVSNFCSEMGSVFYIKIYSKTVGV